MVHRSKVIVPTHLPPDLEWPARTEFLLLCEYPSINTIDCLLTEIQDSLSFSCVCSNGQTPNTANYSQTIPYYECTAAGTQCVNACPNGDTACQTSCRTAHPCGATNPKRVNVTSTSSMAAATTGDTGASGAAGGGKATGQNTFTGFGGSQATSSGNSAPGRTQAMAFSLGETFGLAVVLLSVSGGFFFML